MAAVVQELPRKVPIASLKCWPSRARRSRDVRTLVSHGHPYSSRPPARPSRASSDWNTL